MSKKSLARRQSIIEMWEAGLNLTAIATVLGITRERVRQILKEETGMGAREHMAAKLDAFLRKAGAYR